MIGQVVKDNYRIMDEIGRDVLSTVYLAKDNARGQVVALKVIEPERTTEDQFPQRGHGHVGAAQVAPAVVAQCAQVAPEQAELGCLDLGRLGQQAQHRQSGDRLPGFAVDVESDRGAVTRRGHVGVGLQRHGHVGIGDGRLIFVFARVVDER